MSEAYEGVVFRSDETIALHAFELLASQSQLRLLRLGQEVFGIYRVADRDEPFDATELSSIAELVSVRTGAAVALFYDNRCGVCGGILYVNGHNEREFGDDDAWWVPYDDDGDLPSDGPKFRESELREDVEYDCIFSAIDAALESINASPDVNGSRIKEAFCYDEAEQLAESRSPR